MPETKTKGILPSQKRNHVDRTSMHKDLGIQASKQTPANSDDDPDVDSIKLESDI
jgi:hypothetical protein